MNYLSVQKFGKSSRAFASFFWKRMQGQRYGKAVLNGEKVRIVPSQELEKFLCDIEQYGYPQNGAITRLSRVKTDELIRRVSPIIKSNKNVNNGVYAYSSTPGRMIVYDRRNAIPKLSIVTDVKNPTRDFIEYLYKSFKRLF